MSNSWTDRKVPFIGVFVVKIAGLSSLVAGNQSLILREVSRGLLYNVESCKSRNIAYSMCIRPAFIGST